jgi:alpha-amylase
MADLFLSHASMDKESVRKLAEILSGHWTVWWSDQLEVGQDFDVAIEEQLALAKVVVVLWSKAAVRSRWVKNESRFALERGRLAPALLEEVALPIEFSAVQGARLYEGPLEPESPEVQKLIAAIQAHLAAPPGADAPTALGVLPVPRQRQPWWKNQRTLSVTVIAAGLLGVFGFAWAGRGWFPWGGRGPVDGRPDGGGQVGPPAPRRTLVVLPPTRTDGGRSAAATGEPPALDSRTPVAIYQAFDQQASELEGSVCDLAGQGYSHVQLPPLQRSKDTPEWWSRYQPIDYAVLAGRGTEAEVRRLVQRAHICDLKVIADVVFNHMADGRTLDSFPGLPRGSFHPRCPIAFGDRQSEVNCWISSLPDLDQTKPAVQRAQYGHLDKLLGLGIDGFRFDSARHMDPSIVKAYVDHVMDRSYGKAWNYVEVIGDGSGVANEYGRIAPVTDYERYQVVKAALEGRGDLRSLGAGPRVEVPTVTFGRTHDNIRGLNEFSIAPFSERLDAFLATAFILASEAGVPVVFGLDSKDSALVREGVMFRKWLRRKSSGRDSAAERILPIDTPSLLIMERGALGFFVLNKAEAPFDADDVDVTHTNLEGCYTQIGRRQTVLVERRGAGKRVTRWGTTGTGIHVAPRDAMYFVSATTGECEAR